MSLGVGIWTWKRFADKGLGRARAKERGAPFHTLTPLFRRPELSFTLSERGDDDKEKRSLAAGGLIRQPGESTASEVSSS